MTTGPRATKNSIDMAMKGSMMIKFLMTYQASGGIRTLARSQWEIMMMPRAAMTMALVKTMPDEIFMSSFSPWDAMRTKKEMRATP